ncbi:hypothetical protein JCM10207_006692 [Rhodosporidiobolus poonsookiae]
MDGYPHPGPSTAQPSYLPDPSLPHSRSFTDEVELDMRQRQGMASPRLASQGAQDASPSAYMFPSPRGQPAGSGGGREGSFAHRRQTSTGSSVFPSRPRPRSEVSPRVDSWAGARESVHTVLPYEHEQAEDGESAMYGAAGEQGETYGGAEEEDGRSLKLGGSRPPSRTTVHPRGPNGVHPAAASSVSVGNQSTKTTALDYLFMDDGRNGHASGEGRNGYENGGEYGAVDGYADEDGPRTSSNFSKEEAWYFLRALIGREIQHEEGLLWKLSELDGGYGANGTESYTESISPGEAPILRYLIRHFLLTLPLVRDVSSPNEVPTFWTDGLHPIIRAVHDADLSKPVDRGVPSPTSQLYSSSIRNALERFIAAGLKLSSAEYDSPTPPHASSVPMQQQTTSSTRYNFQPTAPPPAPAPEPQPAPQSKKKHGLSSRPSSATSSSPGRRFSLGRLFGGVDRAPIKTSPPVPAFPPPPTLAQPPSSLSPPETSTSDAPLTSETEDESEDGRRRSAGPARPDSAILPTPLNLSLVSAGLPTLPAEPSPPTGDEAAHPEESGLEELQLARTESHTTGATGLDTASFHSARESAPSRAESEARYEEAEDEDATTTLPQLSLPALGGTELQREASAAGTVRARPLSGTGTDTEGFEYYPSDAANTPTQEQAGYQFSPLGPQNTPKGKQREIDAEPYVIDDAAAVGATLAPPVPYSPPYAPSSPIRSPPRPRTPIQIAPGGTPRARRNKFGLGALMPKRSRSGDDVSPPLRETAEPSPPPAPLAASASKPPQQEENDFVAAMAIPASLMQPSSGYPSSSGHDYQPREAVLPPVLLPKGGVKWPYDDDVRFVRGPEYDQLKWGGFEVDVVGVRKGVFSHSYIIRVRRPARLDEYVVRSESQFIRFHRALVKSFPQAHIRRIPTSDPKNDTIIRPKPSLPTIASATSLISGPPGANGTTDGHVSESTNHSRSRLALGLRAAAMDPQNSLTPSRTATRSSVGSTFARSLRAQSVHSAGEVRAIRSQRSRSATLTSTIPPRPYSAAGSYRSFPASLTSRLTVPVEIGKKMPPHDPRRRALRAWLKDALAVRTVGHHKETAAFLLLGSIVPKDSDVLDIGKRELIDDARRIARLRMAQDAADRVKANHKQWALVEKEVIHGEGLSEISEALRTVSSVDKLPVKYQKVLESLRFSLAETLFDVLVTGDSSGTTFSKLKALHSSFPYFLAKQALRLKGSTLMGRALQDLLLSRPFGGKSLLQKILAIVLDDDPARLAQEMDRLQARIGSATMCEKLSIFVHDSREKKEIIRRYAEENNIELVLCIVRGADEPRLPGFELDRVTRASKAYRKFAKTKPTPLQKAQAKDPDLRLVLDLQAFLRLASRDRDATVLREMLAQEDFAAAVEIVTKPFVQLIKRTYKVGNGAQALSDLQRFLDQLIIIVEALRSRVQDPQKSIRILARLLARHQQAAYTFLRSIHRGETIVEEFLQWGWTASVFLRRGLAQPINLDDLVPPSHQEEKTYLLEELEDLVAFHRQKRRAAFEAQCRRYAGDVDADDPVLVEGDGKGRSRVEAWAEERPRMPSLSEVPLYANAFKEQLKSVFLV